MNEKHYFLSELAELVSQRKQARPSGSYTVKLLDDLPLAAQKVGEEAVEVVVAALAQSEQEIIGEAADLLYHMLVLLAAKDVTFEQVDNELRRRHTQLP